GAGEIINTRCRQCPRPIKDAPASQRTIDNDRAVGYVDRAAVVHLEATTPDGPVVHRSRVLQGTEAAEDVLELRLGQVVYARHVTPLSAGIPASRIRTPSHRST